MARQARPLEPAMVIRPAPAVLMKDDVPLPNGYVPPVWAASIVGEWVKIDSLVAMEAYPTTSILVSGASGLGKTTAARWIGQALKVPSYVMLLSSVVESYLGQTGRNIHSALEYAMQVPCCLILDEIDAIAAVRGGGQNDVGESHRITTTLIQLLDLWNSRQRASVIIATTNLAMNVDQAIRRRFDIEVEMGMPSQAELSAIAGMEVPDGVLITPAALRRMVLQAKRQAVVAGLAYKPIMERALDNWLCRQPGGVVYTETVS